MTGQSMPKMANSARYRICVQGYLDPGWSGRLGGMDMVTSLLENDLAITTLEGELIDQSALLGVMNTLSSLQYPIISVNILDDDCTQK